jgi:hypothetical protein
LYCKNKTNQADGSEGSDNRDNAKVLEFPAGRPSGRHRLAGIALGSNGGRLSALSRLYKHLLRLRARYHFRGRALRAA